MQTSAHTILRRLGRRIVAAVLRRRLQQLHLAIHQAERDLARSEMDLALLRLERQVLQQRLQYAGLAHARSSTADDAMTWGL